MTECQAVRQESGGKHARLYLTDENSHVAEMQTVTEDGEQRQKKGEKELWRKTSYSYLPIAVLLQSAQQHVKLYKTHGRLIMLRNTSCVFITGLGWIKASSKHYEVFFI